jgi:hypothetical protein
VEGTVIRPEWRPITQTSTKPPLLFILQFIHSFSLTHTNNPSIESSILLPLLSHLLPYSPLRTNNANGDSFNFPLSFIHIIFSRSASNPYFIFKSKFILGVLLFLADKAHCEITTEFYQFFFYQFVVKLLSLGLILEIQISLMFLATYMHIVIDLCFDLCGTFQFFILFKL